MNLLKKYDLSLLFSGLILVFMGMATYYHPGQENLLFQKESVTLLIVLVFYLLISNLDIRYLKNSNLILGMYGLIISIFLILAILGSAFSGARS
jgi:cell division protein FtsW (lipid II flippase)